MDLTIGGLLKAYREGETTPAKVINDLLQRCAEYEEYNIWIRRLSRDEIEPFLSRLDTQTPETLPLFGIPFAIKDNIDLAGIPTTAACPDFTYTPEDSAFVVEKLIEAGAIPIGKANMDQFATGLVGTRSPEPWGPCRNAFNKDMISGGSSSGSAVAVALGLVSFSLGTDTAGSGRVPAAFNNLVGLKPSRGLISTRGVVPACRSLDCVSIFALTTDDAECVLQHAAVYDTDDDYARSNPYENNWRHYGMPKGSFTFGVPRDEQLEFYGNDSTRQLFQQTISKLESLGGKRHIIDFDPFLKAARLLYEGPWVAERYVAIESQITRNPDALLPVIGTIIGGAEGKSAIAAFKAEYQMQHYRLVTRKIFSEMDFMVIPTTGTIFSIDQVNADPINLNSQLGYYTNFMNLLDCTGIAVPVGFQPNGLPWGVTFVAPALQDRKLLSYANRWQQALDLPLGATQQPLSVSVQSDVEYQGYISVVVCGAHLNGLPLNWQLAERGGRLQETTVTSQNYRLYALSGGPPYRPALVRDEQNGTAIEVEVWSIPNAEFGSFVAAIPAPLGIGKLELSDGRWLPGFVCEGYGVKQAKEITEHGSWRRYIATIGS